MKPQIEWANYNRLNEVSYLMNARQLFNLETELGKNVHDSMHWSRKFEYPWVIANLQPFSKDDVVLDAGAGNTALQFLVSKWVKEVHSIDTDTKSVSWIKTNLDSKCPNLHPEQADILNLPFESGFFDKTLCVSVLEHLPKDRLFDAINELVRVTKSGGKIAITMDVVLIQTPKQYDIIDMMVNFDLPNIPDSVMVFHVPPYNFPFTVCCMILQKDGTE